MADSYEIISIEKRTRGIGSGQFAHVHEVTYRTKPSGLIDSIDVPDDQFDPHQVDELVVPAAANTEAVKAL